jgi:hypothetical protein
MENIKNDKLLEQKEEIYHLIADYLNKCSSEMDINHLKDFINSLKSYKNTFEDTINNSQDYLNFHVLEKLTMDFKNENSENILKILTDEIIKIDEKYLIIKKKMNTKS